MNTTKTIQSALISVFSKDGLEPIVRKLHEQNVTFYSTGGTEEFIKNLGIPVVPVEDVTSYPSDFRWPSENITPKNFWWYFKSSRQRK
jgi:phosphoribosylaminoimidazolecarboxamide formyltransferase / IMP cyclohydrolase